MTTEQSAAATARGATLDAMRDVAAREAERLAIWESSDGRARVDREAFEGLVRLCDIIASDPEIKRRIAARIKAEGG